MLEGKGGEEGGGGGEGEGGEGGERLIQGVFWKGWSTRSASEFER